MSNRRLVSGLAGRLVVWSICHNFLKGEGRTYEVMKYSVFRSFSPGDKPCHLLEGLGSTVFVGLILGSRSGRPGWPYVASANLHNKINSIEELFFL